MFQSNAKNANICFLQRAIAFYGSFAKESEQMQRVSNGGAIIKNYEKDIT